jgi:hypothetical protein
VGQGGPGKLQPVGGELVVAAGRAALGPRVDVFPAGGQPADCRAFDLCSGRAGLSELDVGVERSGVRNRGGAEGRPLVEVVGG